MANFGKVDLDFTLFLRPFTYNSWAVIGATTLVCCIVALFYQTSSMEKYQEQTSARFVIQYIFLVFLDQGFLLAAKKHALLGNALMVL